MSANDPIRLPRNVKNIIGQRFGRLVVVEFIETRGGTARWLCRCDCGKDKNVSTCSLRSGGVRSCGCLSSEVHASLCRRHGGARTPEYRRWEKMIARCENPKQKCYDRYGGRGIRVCLEWRESFEAFLAHIGPMPGPNYSVERIDNDGHYEPGNVRWATMSEQARNTSVNRLVTIDGETKCFVEWCETFGISPNTVDWRIRNGWSIDRAFKTPASRRPWNASKGRSAPPSSDG